MALIRTLYGALLAGLAALWMALLAAPVLSARPETDLWWMMPLMETELKARSAAGFFAFLLSPAPFLLGQPLLKLHLWLHTSAVSLPISALLALAMGIHLLNAWGVYGLSGGLGFPRRVAAIAGSIYLTMFAHFHAYLWPTAIQHLVAVGTVLALLNFYLSVERRCRRGEKPGGLYAAALAVLGVASFQRSALLGVLLMLAHALWGPGTLRERKTSFDRWLPGWVLSGIYPAFAWAAVGDPRVTSLFAHWALPVLLKALILWGSGVAVLLLIRSAGWNVLAGRLVLLGIAAGLVLWALRDKRQWLFLYNAAVPFAATLSAFLEPVRTALLIPSTEPYHVVPPQVSAWTLLMALAMVPAFWAVAPQRRRVFLLFGVWYGVALLYCLQGYSSFPVRIPSRYFIYLSPLFAILFSAVLQGVCEALARRLHIRPLLKEAALVGLVAALCIPNLIAIRLEIFRGRLANTYLLYEDLRRAEVQAAPGKEDPFDRSMREAGQAWDRGETEEAKILFRRAAQTRPFFLRYTLSPYRLQDVRWLTGGADLRQWVWETGNLYATWGRELPAWSSGFQRTALQLRQELSDYLFCLLALSYLEHQSGNEAGSEQWLSQMGFLEKDGGQLSGWVRENARVKSDPGLREFARRLGEPAGFPDPLPWRKDDYGFALFMTRFLTRW